jgi:CheY-like chemotaxis protein
MRVLLVVDDDEDLHSLFRRFLKKSFDSIHLAARATAAAELLASNSITHLVIDAKLHDGDPPGRELLAEWRARYPSIRFAAIFTGSYPSKPLEQAPGVDAVFLKPNGFDALIERLTRSE